MSAVVSRWQFVKLQSVVGLDRLRDKNEARKILSTGALPYCLGCSDDALLANNLQAVFYA